MKRVLLISLLVIKGITLQAQTNNITITYQTQTNGVIEYAKNIGIYMPCPDVKTDNKTKKTTTAWHQTNMEWIKDYCTPTNFAIEKDYHTIFPQLANLPLDEQPYMPMSWRLTGENNETVLQFPYACR